MSSEGDPVQVETAGCAVAVQQWRSGAGWFDALDRTLGTRAGSLELGAELDRARAMVAETARHLGLMADLLERAVERAAAVGFDLGASELPSELLGAYRALTWSIDDPRGLRAVDLPDPDAEHGSSVSTHFGYVPLWGPEGPSADDVHQGTLGDCSLLAVLASVADTDPDRIRRSIVDHRDGTYSVDVGGEWVTVDDQFPVFLDGTPQYARGPGWGRPEALWPLLYEKAAAIAEGGDFDDVATRDPGWAHGLFGGTDEMSISQWLYRDPSDADVLRKLDEVLDDDRVITATSGDAFGEGGLHAWSVVATGTGAGGATVTVRNPWGRTGFSLSGDQVVNDDGEPIPDADPQDIVLDETDATVTMPLDVFTEQFDELDYVTDWD